jgi:hypothetical protein
MNTRNNVAGSGTGPGNLSQSNLKRRQDLSPQPDREPKKARIEPGRGAIVDSASRRIEADRLQPGSTAKWNSIIPELNEEIKDAIHGNVFDVERFDDSVSESQIGASIWSEHEKLRLYNALALYGRDNLPKLAAAVGKTQSEVRQYILVLEDATLEYKLAVGEGKAALDMRDVPVAVELSDDLVKALDSGAHQIEETKRRMEEASEHQLFGGYWKLDSSIAEDILTAYDGLDPILLEEEHKFEQRPKRGPKASSHPKAKRGKLQNPKSQGAGEQGSSTQHGPVVEPPEKKIAQSSMNDSIERFKPGTSTNLSPAEDLEAGNEDSSGVESSTTADLDESSPLHILSKIPAANLLHLPNFLRLSNHVFMNTPDMSKFFAPDPAIRHTAFNDFHTIVVSVVRRLISVILFQASGRLRMHAAARSEAYIRNRSIIQEDVYAALDILGMKQDSFEFWKNAPRRLNLTCRTAVVAERRDFERSLPPNSDVELEIVEQLLSKPVSKWFYNTSKKDLISRIAGTLPEVPDFKDEDDETAESADIEADEDKDDGSDSDHSERPSARIENTDSEDDSAGAASSDISPTDLLSLYTSTYTQAQMSSNKNVVGLQNRAMLEDLAAEAEEEEVLEAFDAKASAKEEARLWAILKGGISPSNHQGEIANSRENPKSRFLDPEQRSQWREMLEYRAEWEDKYIQGE